MGGYLPTFNLRYAYTYAWLTKFHTCINIRELIRALDILYIFTCMHALINEISQALGKLRSDSPNGGNMQGCISKSKRGAYDVLYDILMIGSLTYTS